MTHPTKLTGSHVHITRNDRSELVLGEARVHLGVHLLPVVLGAERRKVEVAVGQHLPEAGHIADGRAVAAHPDDLRRRVAAGAALHLGAGGVAEVDAVDWFLEEDGAFGVGGVAGGGGACKCWKCMLAMLHIFERWGTKKCSRKNTEHN